MTAPDACPDRADDSAAGFSSGPILARVAKGVGTAIGKRLAVDRDAALPDSLASLVERLHQGPLGQTSRTRPKLQRRVA